MDKVLNELAALAQQFKFMIAYSGGVDSHVLLHLLARLENAELFAVHVHHNLSANADKWAAHCAAVCQKLSIPYRESRVIVTRQPTESLEAVARDLRYKAFEQFMAKEVILLTAHNQNDQAETVLLQLMRGAGMKGLSAMPLVKEFCQGQHRRPLLETSRDEIIAYARTHELTWIEDESNREDKFDRNFLRNQVIPKLESRRPGVIRTIARTAAHIAAASELIEALAIEDFAKIATDRDDCVQVQALQELSSARQDNVMRYWLRDQVPSTAVLHEITKQLIYAAPDTHPEVTWADVLLRRDKQYIYSIVRKK